MFLQSVAAKVPVTSCRSGTPVMMLTAQSVQIPVSLTVSTHEVDEKTHHVCMVKKLTMQEALMEKRLTLQVDVQVRAAAGCGSMVNSV